MPFFLRCFAERPAHDAKTLVTVVRHALDHCTLHYERHYDSEQHLPFNETEDKGGVMLDKASPGYYQLEQWPPDDPISLLITDSEGVRRYTVGSHVAIEVKYVDRSRQVSSDTIKGMLALVGNNPKARDFIAYEHTLNGEIRFEPFIPGATIPDHYQNDSMWRQLGRVDLDTGYILPIAK